MVAAAFNPLAVPCLRWGERLAAGVFGLFALVCSLVFSMLLIVLESLLTRLANLVIDDVASVSVGTGVWVVLVSGFIGLVGSISVLFDPTREVTDVTGAGDWCVAVDEVGWWSKTVRLPSARWWSTKDRYVGVEQGDGHR